MKEKPGLKESKEEKERRALYNAIQGRLGEMRHCLKLRYMDQKADEIEEDIIHGINKGLHDIEHIFSGMLLDVKPTKEILEDSPKQLGTRILPVRWGG